ncbi:unnamed protein product [Rhizophagus irregularis]|uniref:Uncharacterized protein n=1 Tax=Rhizophagus irregularis TaxID=588596 RepID=A0A2I1G8R8_9GLOM|nr:hypothetical protein RhiirA4_456874 [Rhizophagus irregularis]CAB4421208.1 unnamed protein product [Rhizophagus irregularis]
MKELHQSISNISDDKVDELLEHFCGDQHSELLNIARNHFETLDIDTGLVYHFKDMYDFMLFKPLCPAALNALLDVYKDFPLPRDVSVMFLSNRQLNAYNFEEILFQQMLKHSDILLKAMGLAGKPTTDMHIKFEHFIFLDKDQLASNSQHSKFLIRGYECYPQFDFIIGYIFIQVSISSFVQYNKGFTNISKAFKRYHKDGSDLRNQIEIYLNTVFGDQQLSMQLCS